MEWILIEPEGQLNSLQRAKIISRELYNIMRPVFLQRKDEADCNMFAIEIHPDDATRAALRIKRDEVITAHSSCNLERLVSMFPELTPDERYTLSSTIHQLDAILFEHIVPASVTIRDFTYMFDNGWFPPDDE